MILVRSETKPDDVHGMLVSEGILTSRGGRTSHAALVARQFGKPAVVGVSDLNIDMNKRQIKIKDKVIKGGEWISLDGNTGEIYLGKLETVIPDIKDSWLMTLLSWADEFRRLGVWANADYPQDAQRARDYGAEGIGLCRSEHMFFESDRLPHVQKMIVTKYPIERHEALEAVLPFQREDFAGLFRVMDGLPVIIRLLDPPLHEFLPNHIELMQEMTDLKIQMQHADNLKTIDTLLDEFNKKQRILKRVESLREQNPMMGLRGRTPGHPVSGGHHHAGPGHIRGGLYRGPGRHCRQSGSHDSPDQPCQRAQAPTGKPGEGGQTGNAGTDDGYPIQVRYHDRDSPGGIDRRSDRAVRGVLLFRDQRPDSDGLRHFTG